MRKFIVSSLLAGAAFAGQPAQATVCANTDISPSALACAGFFSGNLINGSPADRSAQEAALATLGLVIDLDATDWDGVPGGPDLWSSLEILSPLNGAHTVDFSQMLYGETWIGLHFGNGQGGPGNATAFYKLDAGAGLDTFMLAYNASSNAVVYRTGTPPPPPAVPEPATWAMMIAGLGIAGATLRRRSTRVQFA